MCAFSEITNILWSGWQAFATGITFADVIPGLPLDNTGWMRIDLPFVLDVGRGLDFWFSAPGNKGCSTFTSFICLQDYIDDIDFASVS